MRYILAAAAIACVIFAVQGYRYYMTPQWDTEELVKEEVKLLLKNGKAEEKDDAWGNTMVYHYEAQPKVLTAIVVSNGRDGEFGTDDDIAELARDYNKSRIIGEWAGSKVKEGFKGFLDGLKKKSPFEKEE